jgi:hypothetical protein
MWSETFKITEATVVKDFIKNINTILPSSSVINKINNSKHKPDCWIYFNNEEVPCEAKLGDFNSTALNQLQRYIKFYSTSKGIAIGRRLTVKLPDNIMFFNYDTFMKYKMLI